MNKLHFRSALPDDLTTLLAFEQNVVDAERPYNQNIKTENAFYYNLPSLISSSNSSVIIAEHNDKIIGTGYAQIRESKCSLDHDKHSYLGFMFVEPEYRGQGVNKVILDRLISWSKEQGIFDFYLDVYDGNDAAIKAYEKVGFEKSLVEMKLNLSK